MLNRVKFQILYFCMELALSVWLFKKKKKKIIPKNFLLTTVANSSAQ